MKDDKLNHSTSNEATETQNSETSRRRLRRNRRKLQKNDQEEQAPKKRLWVQLRILPIWLRLILVIFWLAVVVALGLSIGYGYIGDGNTFDIFKKETWTHIIDIIEGKE